MSAHHSNQHDSEDYLWLTSELAAPLLRDLQQQLGNGGQVDVRLAASLRKSQSASRAHLLLEQVELRSRARAKFSQPEKMFFTRKGLEQTTDEVLAAHKATRIAEIGTTERMIVDLCCGVGGDLLAFATKGIAAGYDADAVTSHFAACNLRAFDRTASRAVNDLATANSVQDAKAWHIDPDRRPTGERTIQLADYEPGPDFLHALLKVNPHGAMKIAPAADVNGAEWPAHERQWLGSRGECRQQVLWFGNLAQRPGQHVATIVSAAGVATSFAGEAAVVVAPAEEFDAYIYEPDATILAAQLAGAFATAFQLSGITTGGGYLTGASPIENPLLATFKVRDVLPFDVKKLKAYCREHHLGQLEIKKRGVDLQPHHLRREIMAKSDDPAVIFVTPFAGGVKAIVADRIIL
ncbi:hypothetical protein ETAA8_47250 [Anatilimnocola aggregata]|uniref:THUMP-like domain-containing protein n=1 Tax=Anatilimnocola aggregata TaxID=2528021 RepID=A0A517YHA6_9BACT|nr:hypothetical protein [Anatilimnocola aggregata]QDU29610.1 hypothetical protein ETAA8_47250 [Anatilimnocola aggregata]